MAAAPPDYKRVAGTVLAIVAAANLAELARADEGGVLPWLALFVLGALSAGSPSRAFTELIYALIGYFALTANLLNLFGGGCGDLLGGFETTLALLPVPVAIGAYFTRPSAQIGSLGLALFGLLELSSFAVRPAGVAVIDELYSAERWLVVFAIIGLLAVVSLLAGRAPRLSADAIGILIVAGNLVLGLFDTPCGLATGLLITAAVVFVVGRLLGGLVRRRVGA